MAITIAVASGKGGTGKTTTCANLAVALSQFGKEVTVIDADISMANLELVMGIEGRPITLNDVLAGTHDIKSAIYEGPAGVKVVPAGVSLDSFKKARPERLLEVLSKLEEECEILLIDCPAGIGKEALTAISAAEQLIIVVNPEISSISDALKVVSIANRVETNVLGAIVNRVTEDSSELSARSIETILEVPIIGIVPEDPNVRRSSAFGVPIILKHSDSIASQAIIELAAKLVGKKYIPEKKAKESFVKKFFKGVFGGRKK
ncbi:cell division ATPase MinD [Methanococcus vannielii SB]|jgi:septum site-determining protein MinD|uniref:Cell division ATPase MinD n=1 Tax=Methanococcus vannielii (strain ATCC 35089 / DSM 1224 / JCM 13029 / OCM 148 / SB) TaxID=406327 RepID=A6US86_METVS|nr:cell division ATPase MinD [Methanococcus vannielii]ABR55358.1 cell division ATPase MinD [Methanococcus vannielii SB]